MRDHLLTTLRYVWTAFGAYWLLAARGKSRTSDSTHQTAEPQLFRIVRLSILAVTFALLFWQRLAIGFLGQKFSPEWPALALGGFAATLVGLAVAISARIHLGRNWSDKVVIQSGHELIRTGPYQYMRHPIYSGVLLAVLGRAFVLGEVRGSVAFAILLVNYAIKAKREERILAERFGPEFVEHLRRTGFLWPRLRLR